jgi:hypothetical protein
LLFFGADGAEVPAIPLRSLGDLTRETKMRQVWNLAAPATALMALAFVAMSTPASAGDYCTTNTSGMRGCGFDSMAQCEAMTSGRGGSGCYRDPFLAEAGKPSDALAYQPKDKVHHTRKPIQN